MLRLRLRLHTSSYVFAVMAAVWLVLVNIPGRVIDWQPATLYRYEHGWPWVYLQRETLDEANGVSRREYLYRRDAMQSLPGLGVPWLRTANWKFWEAVPDRDGWGWRPREGWRWNWNGRVLLANGAIGIIVLVGSVAAWEWRRRRRNSWIHFSLAEFFLAVTSVSAILGWLVHMERDFKHETRVATKSFVDFDGGFSVDDHQCIAPVWLRSLIGEKLMPDFTWRVAKVNLYFYEVRSRSELLHDLSELSHIRTVLLSGEFDLDEGPHFPFSELRVLKRLKNLEIEFYRTLDQQDVDELSQLQRLENLGFWYNEEVSAGLLSQLEAKLPGCQIVDLYED